ncbi:MAG: aminoglycoside phosphotransferase family protein, partial [Acidimicrobiia bacterium]
SVLHATVARLAGQLGEVPVPVATRPGQPWVGLTSRFAVHVAHDEASRARIHVEAGRLLWAARFRLPVPEVVECGSGWLLTTRAPNHEPLPDGRYVAAAIDGARMISGVPTPPPDLYGRHPAHGGSRRVGAVRLARLLRSPIRPSEFRMLRRSVGQLARDRLAHGDFHPRNILFDRARGSVVVIDWEFLSYQPANYDLCLLWPRLPSASDRDAVLEAALDDAPDLASLGLLHRWLAVRYLADLVTKTAAQQWDKGCIALAVARVVEARVNAATWSPRPGSVDGADPAS